MKNQASSTSCTPSLAWSSSFELGLVALVEPVDQLVLGRVVVVEVAGADVELGRHERGRNVRLPEPVEQVQCGFEDALRGAPWRFLGHVLVAPGLSLQATLAQVPGRGGLLHCGGIAGGPIGAPGVRRRRSACVAAKASPRLRPDGERPSCAGCARGGRRPPCA